MRHLTAIVTVALLACLGLAGIGNTEVQQPLQIQGTLEAVDCQAQQLTLNASGSVTTFQSTGQTAVFVNGTLTQLCSLQSRIGAPVTVLVAPSGDQFVLGRVDVSAPQAVPPSVGTSTGPSIAGIAIGALLLGGLAYLIIRNANNNRANNNYDRYDYYRGPGDTYGPYRRCPDNSWSRSCR
jgi:hypothetical protein